MLGKVIASYKIKRVLGEGGMATVYEAINDLTNHVVAIKILDIKLSKNESILKRFKNEATLGMAMAHPNIPKIYKYIEVDGLACILMEKIEGVSLSDYIKDKNRLTKKEEMSGGIHSINSNYIIALLILIVIIFIVIQVGF